MIPESTRERVAAGRIRRELLGLRVLFVIFGLLFVAGAALAADEAPTWMRVAQGAYGSGLLLLSHGLGTAREWARLIAAFLCGVNGAIQLALAAFSLIVERRLEIEPVSAILSVFFLWVAYHLLCPSTAARFRDARAYVPRSPA